MKVPLRFSLKSLLLVTVACGAVIAMNVRIEQNVKRFKADFENNKFELHAVTGPGQLQWLKKVEHINQTSLIDYLTFRRKYHVKYDASLMNNGDFNEYHCETHFGVGVSKVRMMHHEQKWYMFWT